MSDKKLQFSFLTVKFKSQVKMSTHFTAINQTVNAEFIITNRVLKLMKHSFNKKHLNSDESQFFSLSINHTFTCINVHWLCADAEKKQFSFYVKELLKHFLNDENSIRAIWQTVQNIMNYEVKECLKTLCWALNVYRQNVMIEKRMSNTDNHHKSAVQVQSEKSQSNITTQSALSCEQSDHCSAEP